MSLDTLFYQEKIIKDRRMIEVDNANIKWFLGNENTFKSSEELYNALQNSKEGWIKISRVGDGKGESGYTYAFGKGISCKVSNIDIQETLINGKDKYHSLNEMVIRDGDLNVLKTDIYINDDFLEEFTGDGILIATSIGSTACNISYGGSIVSPEFSTLQITPIAPINSKVYRTLSNSIVEPGKIKIGSRYKKTIIELVPKNRRVIISIDGDNKEIEDVDSVCSSIEDKKIKMLRFSHYNFPQKINEKLLSN